MAARTHALLPTQPCALAPFFLHVFRQLMERLLQPLADALGVAVEELCAGAATRPAILDLPPHDLRASREALGELLREKVPSGGKE